MHLGQILCRRFCIASAALRSCKASDACVRVALSGRGPVGKVSPHHDAGQLLHRRHCNIVDLIAKAPARSLTIEPE